MLMEGIITPVVTPFRADGCIDRSAFGQMLEHLISAGVHGVIVGGSTGEFYAQTFAERVEMMEFGGRRGPPADTRDGGGVGQPHRGFDHALATAARDLGSGRSPGGLTPPMRRPPRKRTPCTPCGSTGRPVSRSCSTTTPPVPAPTWDPSTSAG